MRAPTAVLLETRRAAGPNVCLRSGPRLRVAALRVQGKEKAAGLDPARGSWVLSGGQKPPATYPELGTDRPQSAPIGAVFGRTRALVRRIRSLIR